MKKSDRKISIIIPTYNRAEMLPDTLNSIKNQTYRSFECLIVDDRSDDDTHIILDAICAKDLRFRSYVRPLDMPKGANTCRNIGLNRACGDYVVFFDSDDLMTPNHLEVKLNGLHNGNNDFIITKTNYFNYDAGNASLEANYNFSSENISLYNYVSQQCNWLTLDIGIVSKIAKQIKFNEQLQSGQEYNYFAKLLTKTTKGQKIDQVVSLRRHHEKSIQVKLRKDKRKIALGYLRVYWFTFLDIKDDASLEVNRNLLYKCYRMALKIKPLSNIDFHHSLWKALISIFGIKGYYYVIKLYLKQFKIKNN